MHLGFARMTTDLVRETANQQGNTFEGDQSHPVMGVRHVKPEQRLGEEVIEGKQPTAKTRYSPRESPIANANNGDEK